MSDLAVLPPPPSPEPADSTAPVRLGPLGRLGRFSFRHRLAVVLAWIAALGLAFGLSQAFGGKFHADYSAPGSDSSQAQQLLADRFPAQSGDTVTVVVRAD